MPPKKSSSSPSHSYKSEDWILCPGKRSNRSTRQVTTSPHAAWPWTHGRVSNSTITRPIFTRDAARQTTMSTSGSLAESTLRRLKVLDLADIEGSTTGLSTELCALELDNHMRNTLTLRLPFDKSNVPTCLVAKLLRRTVESQEWFTSARDRYVLSVLRN